MRPPDRRLALLESTLNTVRARAASLTSANGVGPCKALLRARDAMNVAATEIAAALREYEEALQAESAIRTPLRPPSHSDLRAVTGLGERVGSIFEDAKK